MKIFVIGQCTLHWGRMEYGNIGNYYVIEPFFRDIARTSAVSELIDRADASDGYPGLGYLKKLSVKNHLELVSRIMR